MNNKTRRVQTWQRLIRHTERVGCTQNTTLRYNVDDVDDDEARNTAGAA